MFDRTQAYADLGEEFAAFRTGDKDYELFQGKLLENSTPILLLTDSMVRLRRREHRDLLQDT